MQKSTGPISYKHWIGFNNGEDIQRTVEYPLFSEQWITGEILDGCGPYRLFNTVPMYRGNFVTPQFILRVDEHITDKPNISHNTDVSTYHGGWVADEIASLLSLNLGARIKAGAYSRVFHPREDPKGHPCGHFMHNDPVMIRNLDCKQIIPYQKNPFSIEQAHLLNQYCNLSPGGALALIKSARLYQDALWISESQPAFSWLFFVSAIEMAANHWQQKKAKAIERLKAERPELIELLEPYNSELPKKVAKLISDYIGATKKFTDFIIHFFPDPPIERPNERDQIIWEEEDMRKYLKVIYGLRSDALHKGTPFPMPMCMAPSGPSNAVYCEKPTNTAMMTLGSTWAAKDLPMYLHVFEYIVRNALLKWWNSLIN
jgi:hypothetical protein